MSENNTPETLYTPVLTLTIVPTKSYHEIDTPGIMGGGARAAFKGGLEQFLREAADGPVATLAAGLLAKHELSVISADRNSKHNRTVRERLIGLSAFGISLTGWFKNLSDVDIVPPKLKIEARIPYTPGYIEDSYHILTDESMAIEAFRLLANYLVDRFRPILDCYGILDLGDGQLHRLW